MQYITNIDIQNFRSIVAESFSAQEMNVFVGNNDVGKSNILKALDFFFNYSSKYDPRFSFDDYYSKFAPVRQKKAKEIIIKITIQPPTTYGEPNKVIWKKVWRKSGLHDESKLYVGGTPIPARSRIPAWLEKLRFEYIPAIKGVDYFSQLLRNLHDTLASTVEGSIRNASGAFISQINAHTQEISAQVQDRLRISTAIQVPSDLQDLFAALDFETAVGQEKISLRDRGDGIQARYIPVLLKFIEGQFRRTTPQGGIAPRTIWGYEEPENSLEMSRAYELAQNLIDYIGDIQIFLTTHSPAFYSLDDTRVKKFYVERNMGSNANAECSTIIRSADSLPSDHFDIEMGILPLIAPHIEDVRNKLVATQAKVEEYRKTLEEIDKPTVFVEGITDKKIFEKALRIHKPELLECICIKTNSPAGANWVKDNIIAWVHSKQELKAMCIFDADEAGKEAKRELQANSKAKKWQDQSLLKIYKLKSSDHIRPLFQKQVPIPIDIEDYFPPFCWNHAVAMNWVEERGGIDKSKLSLEKSFVEYCQDQGLNPDELLYLKQIKLEHKEDFANYVVGLQGDELSQAFFSLKTIVDIMDNFFTVSPPVAAV